MFARLGGVIILAGALMGGTAAFAQKPSPPTVPQATNPIPRGAAPALPADSFVYDAVRLIQYMDNEEVTTAEWNYFASLRGDRAAGCNAPFTYTVFES